MTTMPTPALDARQTAVVRALRDYGAAFGFVFGSRARGDERPSSDLDVVAWWAASAPQQYDVLLPDGVDLLDCGARMSTWPTGLGARWASGTCSCTSTSRWTTLLCWHDSVDLADLLDFGKSVADWLSPPSAGDDAR